MNRPELLDIIIMEKTTWTWKFAKYFACFPPVNLCTRLEHEEKWTNPGVGRYAYSLLYPGPGLMTVLCWWMIWQFAYKYAYIVRTHAQQLDFCASWMIWNVVVEGHILVVYNLWNVKVYPKDMTNFPCDKH